MLKKYLKNGPFSHVYTIIIVLVSFVIFNIEDLNEIKVFLKNMFGMNNLEFVNFETIYHLKNYAILLCIAIICSTPMIKNVFNKLNSSNNKMKWISNTVEIIGIMILLVMCTASLVSNSYNPFIYFRF